MLPTKSQFATAATKWESTYEALKLYERGKVNAALARIRWAYPDMTVEMFNMTITMNQMNGYLLGGKITPKGHEYYRKMIADTLEMAK